MFKKVSVVIAILIFFSFPLSAQIVLDSSILKFDTYKVDNDFLNSKDLNYTMFGGPYNYHLKDFNGVDVAFDEDDPSKYWGVGADIYYDIVYYFDSNMKTRRFGYNYDTGGSFLTNLSKVATTSDGKIYAIDERARTIYYWNRATESYEPEGSVGRTFSGPYDICKDSNNNLYILDGPIKHVYRYTLENDNWHIFNSGNDYIDLSQYYNSDWGRLSGIAVNNNGIYVSYNGGVIVRYSLEGEVLQYYWIDSNNLNLRSSYRRNASETWLVSITTGSEGNVYVADSKACKIHIFSKELEYICSWEDDDPERPFENTIRDITFYPNDSPNFLISYPWGFYSYTKQNTLAALQISDDYIYPELVGDQYTGLSIELDKMRKMRYI